jgi:hypothetical protein
MLEPHWAAGFSAFCRRAPFRNDRKVLPPQAAGLVAWTLVTTGLSYASSIGRSLNNLFVRIVSFRLLL